MGLIGLSTIFAQVGGAAGDLPQPAHAAPAQISPAQAYGENQSLLPAYRFIHPTLASKSKEDVGLRLVCVFDTGGSIDDTEYEAQLEAMAKSIESEDFRNAIFYIGGPQSIAITVVDFGSGAGIRIPWVDIRKGEESKFKALADEIRAISRNFLAGTHQVEALELSGKCLENCPWRGKRNVVDMITDGKENSMSNPGGSEADERLLDEAIARLARDHDATVNALITLDTLFPDLEEWAQKHLVTRGIHMKEGSSFLRRGFVKVVATQQSTENEGALIEYRKAMETAFRRKIILEVAEIELEDLFKVVQASRQYNAIKPAPQ